MKKPSSRIRDEIAKLQEQLRAAETREAERIGRVALRAGLGETEIEEAELEEAFEDLAKRFRGGQGDKSRASTGEKKGDGENAGASTGTVPSGAAERGDSEA
ncbi:TraC family protein [Rhizobium tropici]|uniref:TraC family protein n=1 Tax=Rhizobium tropici TaxID=398 RepID=A0A5B0WCJ7_RHITR|nr:conjugal transfer protein TraC [Rhizobium tropici]KAA1183881.1 TraC family protein [Rhizobium tropici]